MTTTLLYSTTYYTLIGTWAFILYKVLDRWFHPLSQLPYPPGPVERSIIAGNAADIPSKESWLTYSEFAKTYGSVMHLRAYHKHIIVLNSHDACVEFLEKRSNIYSDRPDLPIIYMMGWGINAGLLRYGPEWRSHRRIYQQAFKPESSLNYRFIQAKKIRDFLDGLLDTPEDFVNHYQTLPAAVIMSAMYDHDVALKDDFFVQVSEAAVSRLAYLMVPGATVVNMFPILRFIPSWFPGVGFKRFCSETQKLVEQMRNAPLASMEAKMREGKVPNCIAADLFENCKSEEERVKIGDVAGTSFAAAADTTSSVLGTFFYAMAIFPEVQTKAQREIDLLVGNERLVNFDDEASLPYIEALRRELMRWRPVLPLGVMRAATTDDVYEGYHIPKDAIVVYNTWAIAHDSTRYLDPESFNPSRFLREDGTLIDDDLNFGFGFGRRMCPGRHFANATVWLAVASVLQNFNIRKKLDACGQEIPISGEYVGGAIRHLLPFECSITPRSTETRRVIQQAIESNH